MSVSIYRIIDYTTNNVYIGQTACLLCQRLQRHLSYIRRGEYCSSRLVLLNNNYNIECIEECDNLETAKEREIYHIQNTPNCINHVKYKYKYEYKEYQKQFRLEHKEETKKYNQEYREKNKEELNKKGRERHQKNKIKNNKRRRELTLWVNSWGGDKRFNNNLLCIDLNIFN